MNSPQPTSTQDQPTRKIDLNLTQVTAGALAAVTTAVFTSQLGAAGTVIGAGGASIVTTVGTSLYQASLERSRRRVRALALRTKPMSAQGGVPTQRFPSGSQRVPNQGAPNQGAPNQGVPTQGMPNQGVPTQGMPNQGMPTQRFPGAGPTQGMPGQGRTQAMPGQGRTQGTPAPGRTTQVGRMPDGPPPYGPSPYGPPPNGAGPFGTPPNRPQGPHGPNRPGGAPQDGVPPQQRGPHDVQAAPAESGTPDRRTTVLRWSAAVAGAVAAFALSMIVITGFEAASGETLGGNGPGTTVGRVANTQPGPEQPVVPAAPESSAPSSVAPTESSAPSESSEAPESGTDSSGLNGIPGFQRSQEPQTSERQSEDQPQTTEQQAPRTGPALPLPGMGR